MFLEEQYSYRPQKDAHFIHTELPRISVHQSLEFIAFVSRQNELILKNTKTGRCVVLLKSQHGILELLFTHDYILAVEINGHQILAYSLKTGRLKKKITGHTTQVLRLAYCRHIKMIASLSHDQCLLYCQSTLNKDKTLKCSTSSFEDCAFSLSGNVLTTVFTDGSVYLWDPVTFQKRQSALPHRNLKVALDHSSKMVVYNKQTINIANISQQVISYQPLHKFWEGQVHQVGFIQGMLALTTDRCFYLAQISYQHQYMIGTIKQIKGEVNLFTTTGYQSQLILVSQKLKKISSVRIRQQLKNIQKIQGNPLTNQGLVCAGGYAHQGCQYVNDLHTRNNYQQVQLQVQNIAATNYQNISTHFNHQKLRQFVRKNHVLPDKHRPLAYRYLLKLPISSKQFRVLQTKGRHSCAALMDAHYPLNNLKLSQRLKDIISLLAHYHPVFAQYQNTPSIIFPFVCLFGDDIFLCFEILYRLFTIPLAFLFDQFPLANSRYLQNIYQILKNADPQLLIYLKNTQVFTKIVWGLLSNIFINNLPRQSLLSIIDVVLVHINQPQYLMFLCIGYLIYNRTRILSAGSTQQLLNYFEQQHTISLGKYLSLVQKLHQKYNKDIHYQFTTLPLTTITYHPLHNIPMDSVKMHQNKRTILLQQLQKNKQQQVYRDRMVKQMQKMTIQATRDSQRHQIAKQSYDLHCNNQSNNRLGFKQSDGQGRLGRLEGLIDQLTQALSRQKQVKQSMKIYVPSVASLKGKGEEELDVLENRMMQALSLLKPNSFSYPLGSQPTAPLRPAPSQQNTFKSSVNAKLASKLWDLDQLSQENQTFQWQNNMLASMNR